MKKILCVLLTIAMIFGLAGCGGNTAAGGETASGDTAGEAKFKIGIVTGSVSQSEDDRRGAEAFMEEKGSDRVVLATYPDNFGEELETTIQSIVNLAGDPDIKAIVVNQGIPGTNEAFRQIKEKRDDVILLVGEDHNFPECLETADIVLNNDFVARGYLMIKTAHDLGCDTFVHISFSRHLGYYTMQRRIACMQEACKEFGMTFVSETAPDPSNGDVGTTGAQQYIQEHMKDWVAKYGDKAAFFCTNDAHTEPMLAGLLEYGGYFIEADLPSPLMGYPGALGLDLTQEAGDFDAILKKVEAAVVEKGGAGRFGTWACSYGYTMSNGLARYAWNVLEGKAELQNPKDLAAALKESSGFDWAAASYVNENTGSKYDNGFTVYQDTYILGKGFMGITDIEVPEKYFSLKPNADLQKESEY